MVIIKNKGFAPGLALGRHSVSRVSHLWLMGLLRHENLLFVLLDDLLVLLVVENHVLHQLVLYMLAIMMQQLRI
jgi:hypothetical protein